MNKCGGIVRPYNIKLREGNCLFLSCCISLFTSDVIVFTIQTLWHYGRQKVSCHHLPVTSFLKQSTYMVWVEARCFADLVRRRSRARCNECASPDTLGVKLNRPCDRSVSHPTRLWRVRLWVQVQKSTMNICENSIWKSICTPGFYSRMSHLQQKFVKRQT